MYNQMRRLAVILLSGTICLLGLASLVLAAYYNSPGDYEKATGTKMAKFQEAPMLKVKVAAGELLPIEERLPEESLVLVPYEEVGKYGGTLHMGMGSSSVWSSPAQHTIEYMLTLDSETGTKILPNIAKDWKFSKDGKTFTLYLRKGIKWSDGVSFTADDILFWWQDVLSNDELTPIKPIEWKPGDELPEVEKIDDYTVRFHFALPNWTIIYPLSGVGFKGGQGYCFLPKHALEKYHIKYNSNADDLAKKEGYEHWWQLFASKSEFGIGRQQWPDIPSLGPWITKQVLIDGVIYERNPYYFKVDTAGNQLPYIDKIHATIFTGGEMHVMRIITGEIEYETWAIGISDYPTLVENAKKSGYWVIPNKDLWGSAATYYFNQNYNEDPVIGELLRDVRLRRALSVAIDRQEINEALCFGKGVPRQATVLPGCSFYEESWAESYAEYDSEKANLTLDEMGLKWDKDHKWRLRPDGKPLELVIVFPPEVPYWAAPSEMIKEYWEKVGVKVVLKGVDRTYLHQLTESGMYQVRVWCLDGVSESGFIAGNGFNQMAGCTPLWRSWWDTKGKSGEEPPEEIKRIYSLSEKLGSLPEEERNQVAKEICRAQAENLWFIGTVGMMIKPAIASVNLGNVRPGYGDYPDVGGAKNHYLETVFWKQ